MWKGQKSEFRQLLNVPSHLRACANAAYQTENRTHTADYINQLWVPPGHAKWLLSIKLIYHNKYIKTVESYTQLDYTVHTHTMATLTFWSIKRSSKPSTSEREFSGRVNLHSGFEGFSFSANSFNVACTPMSCFDSSATLSFNSASSLTTSRWNPATTLKLKAVEILQNPAKQNADKY